MLLQQLVSRKKPSHIRSLSVPWPQEICDCDGVFIRQRAAIIDEGFGCCTTDNEFDVFARPGSATAPPALPVPRPGSDTVCMCGSWPDGYASLGIFDDQAVCLLPTFLYAKEDSSYSQRQFCSGNRAFEMDIRAGAPPPPPPPPVPPPGHPLRLQCGHGCTPGGPWVCACSTFLTPGHVQAARRASSCGRSPGRTSAPPPASQHVAQVWPAAGPPSASRSPPQNAAWRMLLVLLLAMLWTRYADPVVCWLQGCCSARKR